MSILFKGVYSQLAITLTEHTIQGSILFKGAYYLRKYNICLTALSRHHLHTKMCFMMDELLIICNHITIYIRKTTSNRYADKQINDWFIDPPRLVIYTIYLPNGTYETSFAYKDVFHDGWVAENLPLFSFQTAEPLTQFHHVFNRVGLSLGVEFWNSLKFWPALGTS